MSEMLCAYSEYTVRGEIHDQMSSDPMSVINWDRIAAYYVNKGTK